MTEPNHNDPAPVFKQTGWKVKGGVENIAGDKASAPGAFQQSDWEVEGGVRNVAAGSSLTRQSTKADFLQEIERLKQEVNRLSALDPVRRQRLSDDLDAVAEESRAEQPPKETIVARLTLVQKTLEGAKQAVTGAFELARTVGQVVEWGRKFFE